MKAIRTRLFIIIASVLILLSSCATSQVQSAVDYSDPATWAYYGEGEGKSVDLFLICPTVDLGKDGNFNMRLDDAKTKESFVGALNMERGIYEDYTVMYAPFYRQITFPLYLVSEEEAWPYVEIAYGDVEDAFMYYLENLNDGRPFILAGFSQGAQLALMLLEDHFADTALADNLVAAYCIGWRVTEDDLASYPHLRMAEGEDDTGVIVMFSTEAPEADSSIIVPEGIRTLGINPLNWRTDSTLAVRSLNIGACFTDYSGAITGEIPNLTGCYLDEDRGTLKAVDIIPEDYSNSLFPDGVYHLYDYQFFFRNLEENVRTRLESWQEAHS